MDFKFRNPDLETIANIKAVEKVVGVYCIDYQRAPKDLRVEVIENGDGYFIGEANYAIWGPNQSAPYKSIHGKDSTHDALQDTLEGIIEFDDNSFPDTLLFWEADDGTLYDGSGERISREEAEMRRAAYKE